MTNTLKRLFICVCIFLISFTILVPSKVSFAIPSVDGKAFVLMDAKSGQIITSKNEDKKLPPASTTKVMTAILVLENAKFTDTVKVQHDFGSDTGTTIGLRKGEVVTVEDLLYGMLLLSANDCAITLAEHIGGSEEGFAKLMNEKAKELGCENTNFVTSSGLHDDNHYTTAKDLSIILKEALRYPDFIEIAQQPNHEFKPSNLDGKKHWADNKNYMVARTNNKSQFFYKNTLAGKTGYTPEANNTIVTSAKKDDQTLIVTILDSKNNCMTDAKDLFEYGFKNFSTVKLYSAGDKIGTIDSSNGPIDLSSAKDIFYTVKKGNEENISKSCNILKADLNTSYKKGEKITNGELTVNGEKFTTIDLSSSKDINISSGGITSKLKNKKFLIIIGVFVLLFLILVALFIIKKKKQNNNNSNKVYNTIDKKDSTLNNIKNSKKLGVNEVSKDDKNQYEDYYNNSYDNYKNEYEDDYYEDDYYEDDYYEDDYYKNSYSSKQSNNIKPVSKRFTEKTDSIGNIMKNLQMQAQNSKPNKKQVNNNINNYKQANYNKVQDYNKYYNSENNNYNNAKVQQSIRNSSNKERSNTNNSQRNIGVNNSQYSNRYVSNNNYVPQQQISNNNNIVSTNNKSVKARQNQSLQSQQADRVRSNRIYSKDIVNHASPNQNKSRNNYNTPKNNNSNNNDYWNNSRY